MSDYTIARDEVGAYQKTLAADTIDTVTIERECQHIEVWSDGVDALYLTVDGADPTVGGAHCWELPGEGTRDEIPTPGESPNVVKLISHGATTYSINAGGLGG